MAEIKVGVGAFIVNEEGKVFLGKRSQNVALNPGKWESPGGKLEFGETLVECLQREIREEHGIEVEVVDLIGIAEFTLSEKRQQWIGPAYLCRVTQSTPTILEPEKCDEIGWFTIEEALQLPLTPFGQKDLENFQQYVQRSAKAH